MCAHTNGKLGYKCHPIRIKTKYLIGVPDPSQCGRREEEARAYLPMCVSAPAASSLSTQSGPSLQLSNTDVMEYCKSRASLSGSKLSRCEHASDNNRNRPQRLCLMAMQYGHYDLCWSPVHVSSSAPPYPPYVIQGLSLYHNITWSRYSEHDKL